MANAKIIVIKVGNNNLMDIQIIATPFSISFIVKLFLQKNYVLILHLHISETINIRQKLYHVHALKQKLVAEEKRICFLLSLSGLTKKVVGETVIRSFHTV